MITITKIKRFFMGALVGALFERNTNKTNNKQRVNRGYDSESGTTIQRTQPMAGFLLFCSRALHRTAFDYSPQRGSPLRGQRDKRAVQRLRR
ncbi:hypothetical protein BW261_01295 [Klebsiella aerogenes]|nr:hypothetical protein BW261_01295 [Klebsiella aerogenes]